MKFGVERRPDPTIDVTPMIDIVFQLVLFFMVSTNFVQAPAIQVDLPRSSAQSVLQDDQDLNIWVTSEGAVYVEDEAVTPATLTKRLRAAAIKDRNTLVVIKADAGVDHGRVVAVMDAAQAEGLGRLAIATDGDDK